MCASGVSKTEISARTGVSRTHVWRICTPGKEAKSRTYARERLRGIRDEYRLRVDAVKAELGHRCLDCDQSFPVYVLDFDHRPEEVKLFSVTNGFNYTWNEVLAEISKCDLVCANCHRVRTHDRGWRQPAYDD